MLRGRLGIAGSHGQVGHSRANALVSPVEDPAGQMRSPAAGTSPSVSGSPSVSCSPCVSCSCMCPAPECVLLLRVSCSQVCPAPTCVLLPRVSCSLCVLLPKCVLLPVCILLPECVLFPECVLLLSVSCCLCVSCSRVCPVPECDLAAGSLSPWGDMGSALPA